MQIFRCINGIKHNAKTCNLLYQTYKPTIISKKWTNIQKTSGRSTAINTTRSISCKTWNCRVEYPSWEYKHDIKVSHGSIYNPILKKKGQGQKHPGRWAIAEPYLPCPRKPKSVVQIATMDINMSVILVITMIKDFATQGMFGQNFSDHRHNIMP